MTIKITSTLSGQKETFDVVGRPVRMYVCGMTPKFHPHVGHARIFVAADVIRRYLEYRGYDILHVQNFTDVDDKIIARAELEGSTPEEVAQRYSDSYFSVMDALNVKRASAYPTVTGSLSAIIDYVDGLVQRGYGYESNGDVYFEVARFEHYGQLSGRTDGGQLVGVRKDIEPGKRDPRDFALWKSTKEGEPAWPSPWGPGRPGWHIECSAMVRETLGDQIDIHGGGRDLIFPHHENELAQSEAYTDVRPFTRYWAHAGLVTTGGEKMAHSLENFTTIYDVIEEVSPAALRMFLLQTHYRSPLLYTRESLTNAERALERLMTGLVEYRDQAPSGVPPAYVSEARAAFEQAMDDDFNSPGGLAAIFDLVREVNRRRPSEDVVSAQSLLVELTGVLGLDIEDRPAGHSGGDTASFVDLLLTTRQRLREAKQWAMADEIRDRLNQLGITVEDRPEGAVWRRDRR